MRSIQIPADRDKRVAEILARFDRGVHRGGPGLSVGGRGGLELEAGAVHEWFGRESAGLLAGLLTGVPGRLARGGEEIAGSVVVWVGRACWAYAGWPGMAGLLGRSVFVDPACDADRLWAIDQALRCRGACVIADARRLDMPNSRRLQLAAESAGTLGLLMRPPDELGELSAARTRWRVTPTPNPDARFYPAPRWTVELLRCKGLRPETDARRWVVQLDHDTSHVTLVPDAPGRGVQTPERRLA